MNEKRKGLVTCTININIILYLLIYVYDYCIKIGVKLSETFIEICDSGFWYRC